MTKEGGWKRVIVVHPLGQTHRVVSNYLFVLFPQFFLSISIFFFFRFLFQLIILLTNNDLQERPIQH